MNVKMASVAILCGAMLLRPAFGQEEPEGTDTAAPAAEASAQPEVEAPAKTSPLEDPPLHRWGGITLGVVGWYPQLVGADYDVANVLTSGGYWATLEVPSSADIRQTARFAWHLPKGLGSVVFTYDSMHHDDAFESLKPGQFVFAETQSVSGFAGYADDGLADGVLAAAETKTREFRIDYAHTAFEARWARGIWAIGYRDLDHSRDFGVEYYAIVPDLPPLIPPVVPDGFNAARLVPVADTVDMQSTFSGSGLGASFDLEFPIHRRVSITGGLGVGLYRGSMDTRYVSQAGYYFDQVTGHIYTIDELREVFNDPGNPGQGIPSPVQNTFQAIDVYEERASGVSQFAQSFDVYIGVQVNVWRSMKVWVMMRESQYLDVAEDYFGKHSVAYEGYGVGLSYRF